MAPLPSWIDSLPDYDYKYCVLGDPSRDIRIIEITPSRQPYLEVQLQVVQPRKDNPSSDAKYNALSWCWRTFTGEAEAPKEKVVIDHLGGRYALLVPKNLADALKTLRDRRDTVLRVWVDWICINQKDVEERNNQVQLMAVIYGEADCVYVWLGHHIADSEKAFDFIPELLKMDQFPQLVKDKGAHPQWKALKQLMMRDWFGRYLFFYRPFHATSVY